MSDTKKPAAKLLTQQQRFAHDAALLIRMAVALGYKVTLGDAYRDPRAFAPYGEPAPYGAAASAHKLRLAIDLNLFKDGAYLTKAEDYALLGEYWEGLGNKWGGRWHDGNHFEAGDES